MRVLLPLIVSFAILLPISAISKTASTTTATPPPSEPEFGFEILVDGKPLTELPKDGRSYVEAIRDKDYSVRLTNHLDERVAIALAVDGLNTIDAKHTSANKAAKWVLGPRESLTIDGWQVASDSARRFVFTGEASSYGAAVGDTRNLGVISAVMFREKRRPVTVTPPRDERSRSEKRADGDRPSRPSDSLETSRSSGRGGASEPGVEKKAPMPSQTEAADGYELDDEQAATGSGTRIDHSVEWVVFDLDPSPAGSVEIRYGFRSELVELGVLPEITPRKRRATATGFDRD